MTMISTDRVRIVQGDCIKALSDLDRYSRLLRDTDEARTYKATLIFADPPYNLGINYGLSYNDNRPSHEYLYWCERWLAECYMNLIDNGSLWLLINHEYAADLELLLRKTGLTVVNWITWYESFGVNCTNKFTRSSRRLFHAVKDPKDYIFNHAAVSRPSARQEIYNDKRANPAGRLWDDIWGINPPIPRVCGTFKERVAGFPTQLPLKLLEPIIRCASDPGDLVIDPFSGSGTTCVASLLAGRRAIGIELNPEYVQLSQARLTQAHAEVSDNV